MKEFNTITAFNEYLGVDAPLSDDLDVGYYRTGMLTHSEPVRTGFYRISVKANLLNTKLPSYDPADPKPVNAVFFSSPDMSLEWDTNDDYYGIYIQVSPRVIEENRHLFQNFIGYGQHEQLHVTDDEVESLMELFRLLYKAYRERREQQVLLAFIRTVVAYIEEFYHRQFQLQDKKYNQMVSEFQQMLHSYYDEHAAGDLPTVAYFAERLHVSANYLGDIVKFFTHTSAIEQVHKIIMNRARLLLDTTQMTSAEIAYTLGFDYPNYFARFFKKNAGMTPKEYRSTDRAKLTV